MEREITEDMVRTLVKPALEHNLPQWDDRVRDMMRVFAWFQRHDAEIKFSRREPMRWWLIGPDAGRFPVLSIVSREKALWYAHHYAGYVDWIRASVE